MRLRIAIVSDDPGWHGARLRRAFRARGCDTRFVSLRACRFDLPYGVKGLHIPAFDDRLPDGVFVRGVPGGTLQEIVFYLDVLHALRDQGVPVYNDGRAIERSVDKGMTSFLLHRAGIATPPAWTVADRAAACAVLLREAARGHELVLKPLFGSRGRGVRRLAAGAVLPEPSECDGVYYLQRFVPPADGRWQDWRVFVIGGRAVAAMRREGRDWITNVARGSRCCREALSASLAALASDAVRVLNMDYAGVDIMRDASGGCVVIEVNGIPAWRGLQRVSPTDLAQCLVDDFLERHFVAAKQEGVQ